MIPYQNLATGGNLSAAARYLLQTPGRKRTARSGKSYHDCVCGRGGESEMAEDKKTVRVWDCVAGHYTVCHILSASAQRRAIKLAA